MVIWWRPPVHAGSFDELPTGPEVAWRPDLDIYESAGEYALVFDVPGVQPEDLEVTLDGLTLSVAGVRRGLPGGLVAHLLESPRGSFGRLIRLPGTAEVTGLRTELRDGQLIVTVPKRAAPTVTVRIGVARP
ncbi:MAG: Hsp20/alpha crystallin family protein [Candidatus Dormibacteraeota bacterium]|nr:Hsp20/alpha crystallin family protein [Candidatus Dormibacteraeota bacterium]